MKNLQFSGYDFLKPVPISQHHFVTKNIEAIPGTGSNMLE
jgi:hypothetical protein